jgi:hypothetical protein
MEKRYMFQCLRRIGLVLLIASPAMAQDAPPADAGTEPPPVPKGHVYRSVDAQGHVIFTDAPPAGRAAEEVKITPVNTLPAASAPAERSRPDKEKTVYERFTITSPSNDAAFGQEVEAVDVTLELSPPLQGSDTVQFFLDGKPLGEPAQNLAYTLTGLERGTHTVEARLYDAKGRQLMSTGSVQFHLRRISALNKVSDSKPVKPQGWLGRWWAGDAVAAADAGPVGGYGSPKGAGSLSGAGVTQGAGGVAGMPGMGGPAGKPQK